MKEQDMSVNIASIVSLGHRLLCFVGCWNDAKRARTDGATVFIRGWEATWPILTINSFSRTWMCLIWLLPIRNGKWAAHSGFWSSGSPSRGTWGILPETSCWCVLGKVILPEGGLDRCINEVWAKRVRNPFHILWNSSCPAAPVTLSFARSLSISPSLPAYLPSSLVSSTVSLLVLLHPSPTCFYPLIIFPLIPFFLLRGYIVSWLQR